MTAPSNSRPDLEEFFGALGGFLKEDAPPSDVSYQKFVGIFCRSIGAPMGHLLKPGPSGRLESQHLFGLDESFSDSFNSLSENAPNEPSPLHRSFNNKQVIAISDINKDPLLPAWFRSLMNRQGFHSLVAIPLMRKSQATGVLCAYYLDVCLFDQGTLDHLLAIGRMVGSALEERPAPAPRSAGADEPPQLDQFIDSLLQNNVRAVQIVEALTKFARDGLDAAGLVFGRLQKKGEAFVMSVDSIAGISTSALGKSLAVPPFLMISLLNGSPSQILPAKTLEEWGAFRPLIKGRQTYGMISPLGWNKELKGAVIAWRSDAGPFARRDGEFLKRMTSIASLALRSSPSA